MEMGLVKNSNSEDSVVIPYSFVSVLNDGSSERIYFVSLRILKIILILPIELFIRKLH